MKKRLTYSQDFVIREVDFPSPKLHGMILNDEDDRGNIYVRKNDPDEKKKRTVKHELLHYIRNDLSREDTDAAEAEVRAIEDRCNLVMLEDCDEMEIEIPDEDIV